MDKFFRKLSRKNKANVGEKKPTRPDFDPNATQATIDRKTLAAPLAVGVTRSSTIEIKTQDESPPAYTPGTEVGTPPSADIILQNMRDANNLHIFGVKGAFNVLRDRHFHVHFDCSYTLLLQTRKAILLIGLYLLLVAKVFNCDMTFFFTGYPNRKSVSLSPKDSVVLDDLLQAWCTNSWAHAVTLVEMTKTLKDLRKWMDSNVNANDSEAEKHTEFLIKVQKMMLRYTHGWHQRDLDMDRLPKLFNSAFKFSEKQSKCLNHVRFTYEREIKHYLRLQTRNEANPLTCVFILGSSLQPTEVRAIQQCQEVGAKIKAMGKQNFLKRQQESQGTEFQISAIVCAELLSDQAAKLYRDIDDFAEGILATLLGENQDSSRPLDESFRQVREGFSAQASCWRL